MSNFVVNNIIPVSLIDYPDKVATVLFTKGCNFDCLYCHNRELIAAKGNGIPEEEVLQFLGERRNDVDCVCISGGEPTIQLGLLDFVSKLKVNNFSVKLDTNGSNPSLIKRMLDQNLLDYIAMDVKAPLEKYREVVAVDGDFSFIQKSIDVIRSSSIDYEFRTTVVPKLLTFESILEICSLIKGAKRYVLQQFYPSKSLDKSLLEVNPYIDDELERLRFYIQDKQGFDIEEVLLRG